MGAKKECLLEGCDWIAHTGWYCGRHKEHEPKKLKKEIKRKLADCTNCHAGRMVKYGKVNGKQRMQCNRCKVTIL